MAKNIYDYFRNTNNTINGSELEKEFNKPMPLIGIYIAVASLVCTLAMVVDVLRNFRRGRIWFPCRFFALNAASLTVIAVAMKLPVDLNNPMYGRLDQLAKFSSSVFLCTMLANFMPSLGAMEDMELLMHVIALAIMVITISVNLCIEMSTKLIIPASKQLFVVVVCSMLLQLIIMSCSALTVSVSKKVLELRYLEMHKNIQASNKDFEHTGRYKIEKLKDDVTKYWIMAITSSPQFVMACSEACCACGAICVMVDVLLMLSALTTFTYSSVSNCDSVYQDSMVLIVIIQCIGVAAGSIPPVFRLFGALSFRLTVKWSRNYLKIFKIESYWTQRLVQWKQNSPLYDLPIIAGRKLRRCIHGVKNLVLDFCIKFVTAVVVLTKVIRLLSNFVLILFFYCYFYFGYLKRKCMNESSTPSIHCEEAFASKPESLSCYLLQFQDGVELSNRTLKKITKGVDKFVGAARKRKPKNLMKLLEKSKDFDGVIDFDNDQVSHLRSQEPPNCWSLTVITLTTIAMALPNIEKGAADSLIKSVKEGLSYTKQIENTLDVRGDLAAVRKAGQVVWHGVELRDKWLKHSLRKKRLKSEDNTLQWLCDEAKTIVMEEITGDPENPDDWSIEAIAANSMYRICQTIMLGFQGIESETNKELFEQLSKMIADIMWASFTNLPRVISTKCCSSAIEKREESVRTAAFLLGEAEEILEISSQRELPSLDLNQMACIDEWRRSLKLHM